MTDARAEHAGLEFVEADLTFTVDTGVKPVAASVGPAGHLARHEGTFVAHKVKIVDGRPLGNGFTLEKEGFVFVRHDTKVKDFFDSDELESVYYPEMEQLIGEQTGAARVVIFDHTLRSGNEKTRAEKLIREPVPIVHNDFTEWSGPQRVRDILPDEADELLNKRFAVIQVWRPINDPVENMPLAMCDATSMRGQDLIAAERRHPDRVGEIYHIAYNPAYRWYYFPKMRREEALVFTCYDSARDGRARWTAHGSFAPPHVPPGAPPRESIEIRSFAFFDTV